MQVSYDNTLYFLIMVSLIKVKNQLTQQLHIFGNNTNLAFTKI